MKTKQYLNIFRDSEISPHTICDIEDIYKEKRELPGKLYGTLPEHLKIKNFRNLYI